MVDSPLVSVILPVFNRADIVKKSIRSVLNQSYNNLELIVIDDGSTDDTPQAVKSVQDDRIIYIRKDNNKGANTARNTGLKAATGEYIAYIDSDVVWLPDKIKTQVDKIESANDKTGVVHCYAYSEFDGYFQIVKRNHHGNIFEDLISSKAKATTSSLLIDSSCFDQCGGWDEDLRSFNEYDMLLRFAEKYRFEVVQKPMLFEIDHTNSSITVNVDARRAGIEKIIQKWGQKMVETNGEDAIKTFKLNKYRYTYRINSRWHVRNNRRIRGLQSFILYMYYKFRSRDSVSRMDLLLFISLIGGRWLYDGIMKRYYKYNGKSKEEITSNMDIGNDYV
jgi:glycosyltransferase involved in cell wall biosynthesis